MLLFFPLTQDECSLNVKEIRMGFKELCGSSQKQEYIRAAATAKYLPLCSVITAKLHSAAFKYLAQNTEIWV